MSSDSATPRPDEDTGQASAEAGEGAGAPDDALFQALEPTESTPRRVVLLWQYFLFPLMIVAAAVGVFLLFGLIGGSRAEPVELLDRVRTGGENVKQQASHQLALEITLERRRVDAGEDAERPPFYASPAFREGLRVALHEAAREGDVSRQEWLAVAAGLTRDVEALPQLERLLYPAEGDKPTPPRVRRRVGQGVFEMAAPASLPLLARMTADDDPHLRAFAHLALARLVDPERGEGGPLRGDPRVAALLREGLEDPDGGVRINAAVGLALLGDDRAGGLVARSLDRRALTEAGIKEEEMQVRALVNAIKAARLLAKDDLHRLVERLADDATESSDLVRTKARQALARWNKDE